MRKPLASLLFVLLMVSSFAGRAAEFGLGVALNGGDAQIFMPINIGEQWRVEPSLLYSRVEASDSDFVADQYIAGLGAFRLWRASEQVRVLPGVRLLYVNRSQKAGVGIDSRQSEEGYGIAPTLGFEYAVIPSLVVGAEVALEYVDLELTDSFGSSEIVTTQTKTAVTLKYFF
jgi:hypothetical protein